MTTHLGASAGRLAQAGLPAGEVVDMALILRDVSKSYGPVHALQQASIAVAAGEIHALVGENGSGKSTLVGVVSGIVKPDEGMVSIAGTACSRHLPWESQRLGALTVFQDGSILGDLTVAQNLYLGSRPADRPGYRRARPWAEVVLADIGLARIPVDVPASSLSPADRQLLEIARAVMAKPALLVLDEATSALDAGGVDAALGLMRRVADDGGAVLFVTHRLSEVFRIAEKVSVLRDGVSAGTYDIGDVDPSRLVDLMAGTTVDLEFPPLAAADELGAVLLAADGLEGPGYGAVSVEVRAGEIVGIAGAADNGQQELLRALAVVDPHEGTVSSDGTVLGTYAEAVKAGLAYLPRDRRHESLLGSLSIRENLVVGALGSLSRLGWIGRRRELALASASTDRFAIRMGSGEDPIESLSGGNQQKVALARILATAPDVLLIDEPTIGVDVRSRKDIYRTLRSAAQDGKAVVVVSSDASELAGLCDRVLVLSRGRIVAELEGASTSEEEIVGAFVTGRHAHAASREAPGDEAEADVGPAEQESSTKMARAMRAHPDLARLSLLSLLIVGLAAYMQTQNGLFLSELGIGNVLIVALPLVTVAFAQYLIMFVGGIDVSVGGTVGVTVIAMSFLVGGGSFVSCLLIACVIAVVVGAVVGTLNWALVEKIRVSPIIATIATLSVMQGIALRLRPVPDGVIDVDFTQALTRQVGPVPVALIVVAVLLVAVDRFLRSTGQGLRLRATGLNPQFAYRLGVNVPRLRRLAYVSCAVVAAFAGVLVSAQVGIGDPTVGNQYILLAIAAPILGGASLLGGRGLAIGCLLGALLLAITQNMPTVLGLGDGAGVLAAGALTLIPLLIYADGTSRSIARGVGWLRSPGRSRGGDGR